MSGRMDSLLVWDALFCLCQLPACNIGTPRGTKVEVVLVLGTGVHLFSFMVEPCLSGQLT
eukprot:1136980-Pelagomonas_calceolata.AAC.1